MHGATRFTILLCTHQGAPYLAAQLQSYLAQTHTAWDLWASDDGSRDGTRAMLEAFRAQAGPGRAVRIIEGPGLGAFQNFMSLLCHPELPPGPVAISDQDDVWLPCKLERAAATLAGAGRIALYGAQSHYVDANLQVIGSTRPLRYPPCFANALVQNIVSGHSAVLSAGALALVRKAGIPAAPVPYHDWWLYQLVSGAGGAVMIDPQAVLLYRQHGNNVMGAHSGFRASLERARMILQQHYSGWLEANMTALTACGTLLTPDAQAKVANLLATSRKRPLSRARAFFRAGIHRQTPLTTAVLYLSLALGRT